MPQHLQLAADRLVKTHIAIQKAVNWKRPSFFTFNGRDLSLLLLPPRRIALLRLKSWSPTD